MVTREADCVIGNYWTPVLGSCNFNGTSREFISGVPRMVANECDETGSDSAFDHTILAKDGVPHGRLPSHHG